MNMFESIFSQVVATLFAAALLSLLRIAFEKYKRQNDWLKATISYVISSVIFLLLILFGLICVHRIAVKILVFLVISVFFTINAIVFASTMRLFSQLEKVVQRIPPERADCRKDENIQP